MKTLIPFGPVLALAAILIASPASAQLSVGSDGSDGALNITVSTVIDLSQAVTGTWSANNAAHAGKGIYDATQWAVVFKYSSVTVASGATVTFTNHYGYPPVVWLVQTNVTITGTVSVNGNNGTSSVLLTEPGPGGFRGGGTSASGDGDGLGPGGGTGFNLSYNGGYQTNYGNPQVLPLIGGSGSAESASTSGGAGGGAILIAAGGTVTVNGQITATPGSTAYSVIGAGGGIRVVANQIAGSGSINAAPQGRTRMEANGIAQTLTVTPSIALVAPGTTPVIFPAANSPTVSIVSVGGKAAPADPAGNVISAPDVSLATNSPVSVVLQTQNFPTTGSVTVRVVPLYGTSSVLTANYVSGNSTLATWQAATTTPVGYCVLQAHATSP